MRKDFTGIKIWLLFVLSGWLILSSCVNQKKATYFNNLPDSSYIPLAVLTAPQQPIQINDILYIRIGGESEKTVQYINQYLVGGNGAAIGVSPGVGGGGLQFTVDINGNIDLPKVGKIKVLGLTKDQAKDTIKTAYSEYLQDPIISLDLSPFKFAVLGEVKAPGYYSVQNERINIFEAMALAGDMTEYAKKNDVKIIRQAADGTREIIGLNFNDKSILNSPYYYLNRYDIIFVEPLKVKLINDNTGRTSAVIAAVSSVLALVFVIFKK